MRNSLPQENVVYLLLFPTLLLDITLKNRSGVVAHALNPSTGEAVRQISELETTWSLEQVPGQSRLQRDTLSRKKLGGGQGVDTVSVCNFFLSF